MDDGKSSRPANPPQSLFTVEEAVPILRIGRSTLYELVREQKVPHRKIQGRRGVYFTADDLQQIIDAAARPALASS